MTTSFSLSKKGQLAWACGTTYMVVGVRSLPLFVDPTKFSDTVEPHRLPDSWKYLLCRQYSLIPNSLVCIIISFCYTCALVDVNLMAYTLCSIHINTLLYHICMVEPWSSHFQLNFTHWHISKVKTLIRVTTLFLHRIQYCSLVL